MIEVYYWPTPNGHKVTMFLEEAGTPYEIKPINIGKGDQFEPDFLKISPNNRMPAIIDTEPAGQLRQSLDIAPMSVHTPYNPEASILELRVEPGQCLNGHIITFAGLHRPDTQDDSSPSFGGPTCCFTRVEAGQINSRIHDHRPP